MLQDARRLARGRVKAKVSQLDRMEAKFFVTIGDRLIERWKEQ
jgi:hypothetical protein